MFVYPYPQKKVTSGLPNAVPSEYYKYYISFLVSSPGSFVFLQVLRVLGIKYQYSRAKMPPKGKRKAKTTLGDKPGKKKKQGKIC